MTELEEKHGHEQGGEEEPENQEAEEGEETESGVESEETEPEELVTLYAARWRGRWRSQRRAGRNCELFAAPALQRLLEARQGWFTRQLRLLGVELLDAKALRQRLGGNLPRIRAFLAALIGVCGLDLAAMLAAILRAVFPERGASVTYDVLLAIVAPVREKEPLAPVGYLIASCETFHDTSLSELRWLCVRPETRGSGLGALLLGLYLLALKARDIAYVVVFALFRAQPLYARLGFEHAERALPEDWLRDERFDSEHVNMALRLADLDEAELLTALEHSVPVGCVPGCRRCLAALDADYRALLERAAGRSSR